MSVKAWHRPHPRCQSNSGPAHSTARLREVQKKKNAAAAAAATAVGERVNRGRSLKMAAALGSAHLSGAPAAASAGAPAAASVKSPLVKPSEARGTPDSGSQPSRDFQPPPPKKVRVEERGNKTKKLLRDGGVGGNGGVKEKLQQPARSCSSGAGSWSVSPGKTSSSSGNPSVPATGGSQPPSNTHKLFKQSDFFLHKAPSSSPKPKKTNKDKEREKVKGDGEEKKKHKLCVTPGPGSDASNPADICRFEKCSAMKRENGEVSARPQGRPP